jgi:tetratricopeptide (TPR) repeat protein
MNRLWLSAAPLAVLVVAAGCALAPTQPAGESPAGLPPADDIIVSRPPEAPAAAREQQLIYELLVAEIAGRRGMYDASIDNYLSAARQTHDAELAERAARVALFAKLPDKALEAVNLWLEYAPDNQEAHQLAAALYIKRGEFAQALPHLERSTLQAADGDRGQAFQLIASLLSREDDAKAALQAMKELVQKYPNDPDALFAYGTLAARANDYPLALQATDRALAARPRWYEAIMLRAHILQQQGRTGDALAYLGAVVDAQPEETRLRLAYARLLVGAKRLPAAYAQFKVLEGQLPDDGDVQFFLGLIAMDAQRYDEAARHFRRLIDMGERADMARFFLGQTEEARGRPAEAIRLYEEVEEGDSYLEAHLRLAMLLSKQGKLEQAREVLHALHPEETKERIQVYMVEAELLDQAGRRGEALAVYDHALKELPDDKELLYARALQAEKVGRLDILERDLKRVLELDPKNAYALNALGYTLADRTDRYQEALGYISRALELLPNDAAVLDSMGWVKYRLGKLDESVGYLRRALQVSGGDAEIAAHLGEVLWATGDKAGAREVLMRAKAGQPNNAVLLDVMRRLKE